MDSIHKKRLYKTARGRIRYRAREHYLRKDINVEVFDGTKPVILVDYFTVCHQLDLFEQTEFHTKVDIVLLGSTVHQIQQDHRRLAKRVQKVLLESPGRVRIFSNQHCQSTFEEQKSEESVGDYQ